MRKRTMSFFMRQAINRSSDEGRIPSSVCCKWLLSLSTISPDAFCEAPTCFKYNGVRDVNTILVDGGKLELIRIMSLA